MSDEQRGRNFGFNAGLAGETFVSPVGSMNYRIGYCLGYARGCEIAFRLEQF